MKSGIDTLHEIERALQSLQTEEGEVRARLEQANTERANLLTARLSSFRELAQLRTKNALADGVIDQADRLSEQVASILSARQKTLSALHVRADEAQGERGDLLNQHADLLEGIETLETRLDELADDARSQLSSKPDYKTARRTFKQAQSVHGAASAKTKQAKSEQKTKGEIFEADPLFMYLWKRGYGKSGYQASNLIKWLDGHVARFIRYHDAKANYLVLNEIPLRLDEHVERLREKLDAARDAVSKLEAAKIRDLAGSDLPGDLETARATQDKQNIKLERLAGELSETVSQINVYAEGRDRSFLRAIELSAGFLEQESLSQLTSLARHTISPSDDEIVARIANIDRKVTVIRKDNQDLQDQLETAFKRKEELIRLSADFRHSYYDDPGSVFMPGTDTQQLLELLLRGAITAGQYWMRTQSNHGWRSRSADPYRRSNSLPPFRGSSWGSSGRSSGGGRDFTTGGGF